MEGALAAAAVRLLGDPLLRERLGQAAAAVMQVKYSWSGLAQRAVTAYREVLATKAAP